MCAGVPRVALAQDVVMADAYFTTGIKALEEGKFDIACPDLAKSHKLDPKAGTLFALADCERQRGRVATALAWFDDYLRQVAGMPADKRIKHAERVKKAEYHKAGLAKEIPTLAIVLPANIPANAKVFRDGTELSASMLGVPVPIDPGEHVVQVDVEGAKWPEQRVRLDKGEAKRLEIVLPIVASKPVEEPKPAAVVNVPEKKAAGLVPPVVPPDKPANNGLRTGGFVALGVGVVGFVAWGVTGSMAIQKKSAFDEKCPNNTCPKGVDDADWYQGRTLSNVATIGLGVGVAGVAAGAVMLVVGQRKAEKGAAKPGIGLAVIESGPAGAVVGVQGVLQ